MGASVWVVVAAAVAVAAIQATEPTFVRFQGIECRNITENPPKKLKLKNESFVEANIIKLPCKGVECRNITEKPLNKLKLKDVSPVEAHITEFPFMVSVQLRLRHHCGGSLFSPRLVLTTARCSYSARILSEKYIRPPLLFMVGDLSVLMGTANRDGFTMDVTYERRGVIRALPHEHFNPWGSKERVDYDIALLLLSHEVPLSDAINLVPLKQTTDPMPKHRAKCNVVGWGPVTEVSESGCSPPERKSSLLLMKVEMHYMENCTTGNTEDHVCATWKKMQACMGDTGSPLICDGRQLAFVAQDCLSRCPGSFYRLDQQWQADWLHNATEILYEGHDMSTGALHRTTAGLFALVGTVRGTLFVF